MQLGLDWFVDDMRHMNKNLSEKKSVKVSGRNDLQLKSFLQSKFSLYPDFLGADNVFLLQIRAIRF